MSQQTTDASDRRRLAADGFAVLPGLLAEHDIVHLEREIRLTDTSRAGNRRFLDQPWCFELSERISKDARARPLLPANAFAAQCTLFAKTPARNWMVALHQDLAIPVARKIESPACSAWSEKHGQVFVQPPLPVLEELVAIRVHLDDCDVDNGALRVVPGTHALGKISAAAAATERDRRGEVCVPLRRGDAMVIKPLLLHASSKATNGRRRRVLHFVFGPPSLPEGLEWASRG